MRVSEIPSGTTFSSFKELGAFVQNDSKKTKKMVKDPKQEFAKKHLCPACKEPMEYLEGTSVMVCKNSECKGIEVKAFDSETGKAKVSYKTPYQLLDDKGTNVAYHIWNV